MTAAERHLPASAARARGDVVDGVPGQQGGASLRRFKRYPAYKDSGVGWLGEIPAHWQVRRLKTLAAVQLSNVDKKSLEGQEPVRLCNYVDVYYNEHIIAGLDFMTATATLEQVRRFSLHAGDVLITKDSESWTDIAVPAVVTSDLPDLLCGYHLALVRPGPDCHGAFLARAFSAIGPRDQFQVAANGITRCCDMLRQRAATRVEEPGGGRPDSAPGGRPSSPLFRLQPATLNRPARCEAILNKGPETA